MRRLREFWEIYPNAESALQSWCKIVEKAEWQTFAEVRKDFPSADQVKRLTVFNIAGNKCRLVARIDFQQQRIYIRQVMTHAEYDKEKWKNDRWFQ